MTDKFKLFGAGRHLSIFLGAGASAASGLPNWNELARRLLVSSKAVNSDGDANLLVNNNNFTDPAFATEAAKQAILERSSGLPDWKHTVQNCLYDGVPKLSPSPLDYATAEYVLGGTRGDTTLMTLNFDILLEKALAGYSGLPRGTKIHVLLDGHEPRNAYGVHHLHGVITPTDSSPDVVLTFSDFNELLADQTAWQRSFIKDCIQHGDLLIAGTTYRDPDIRSWLHAAMRDEKSNHRAYVLLTREALELSREQFDKVKHALEEEWKAVDMTPLLLQDHTDAAQILRELRKVNDPGYESPQDRAKKVWQIHKHRFDKLQEQYVQQLQRDAEWLHDIFGTSELNVSLWLADGCGCIARWASQDRRYRSAADLHRVNSGHDSTWIAGEALGKETILFKNLSADRKKWFKEHIAPIELPEVTRLESSDTHRWKSVVAIPISVQYRELPVFFTAVLSIGLPKLAESYKKTGAQWNKPLQDLANQWGDRLNDNIR